MRDYQLEFERRTAFIAALLKESGCQGIVYGNSGGKDSALVGILCKAACENTVGLILPCSSRRNYEEDAEDACMVAKQYEIETRTVDLTPVKEALRWALTGAAALNQSALANLAPRLRMAALYAVAASENRLVAGTGNRSEAYVGYFTKWGDGACDLNPIADLTVTEVYQFLRYLKAPRRLLEKAPSAGLFDGQTDEGELGVSYEALDAFLAGKELPEGQRRRVEQLHCGSSHKRRGVIAYSGAPAADQGVCPPEEKGRPQLQQAPGGEGS